MCRKAKSIQVAVSRAADLLKVQGVDVRKEGAGFVIAVNGKEGRKLTAKRTLAHLADIAEHRSVPLDGIRWIGPVPTCGLKGWEEAALRRLQLKED